MVLKLYLQCHAVLEDGNLTITIGFVSSLLTIGDGYNLVNELGQQFRHICSLNEFSGIEVYPVILIVEKPAVC